ncbi:Protein kinase domain [Macleaya cordata]|uniref:Protein kinase domain n=1 Tax=Macleaya cordata TaxID=56857 RepID=A0A200R917_MACCD|nr:Protein kinase domain [Macleaya cordata]
MINLFMRYESNAFFDQTTLLGNKGVCGNKISSQANAFNSATDGLLADLVIATPRIGGFFAAAKKELISGSNSFVYGVAQCAVTVSEAGCNDCLTVAHNNIQNCPPNADGRAVDAGCFLRYSDTAFFLDNQTIDLTPFLRTGGSSSKKKIIIGGVVGGAGFIFAMVIFIILFEVFRRKPKKAQRGDILGATELRGPVTFGYNDLKSATKNFSEENKLGEGGFGDVYKGTLRNGKIVAVKKLTFIQSSRAKTDFESEVKLISNVHHRNLVRLLGCCSKSPELLLVYEYMANSSLDKFLYGDRRGSLNWKQRFDIIVGIARGLAYLHNEFHARIIHRDIKSSNILLDEDFQPKIADFGLARLLPEDQSHLSTKFAGTLGYTAPEYAIHGQLSEKVDTYSFGVVILEIISGRKSNDMRLEPVSQYLLEWYETIQPVEQYRDWVNYLSSFTFQMLSSTPKVYATYSGGSRNFLQGERVNID